MSHRRLFDPRGTALPLHFPGTIMASADRDGMRAKWHECFQNRSVGERQPKALEFRAASPDTTELMLYDEIGYWGITAQQFTAQLAAITTPSILVRINSPGGDVFDGLAMYHALQSHPAQISTQVDGWAASAASFVAMAGDTVAMAPNSFLMIHKAWSIAIGNADDMRAQSAVLDKIDGQLAAIYAKKTSKPAPAMLALMAAETWMDADEALAGGFVDAICPPDDTGDETTDLTAAQRDRVKAMRRRLALAAHD